MRCARSAQKVHKKVQSKNSSEGTIFTALEKRRSARSALFRAKRTFPREAREKCLPKTGREATCTPRLKSAGEAWCEAPGVALKVLAAAWCEAPGASRRSLDGSRRKRENSPYICAPRSGASARSALPSNEPLARVCASQRAEGRPSKADPEVRAIPAFNRPYFTGPSEGEGRNKTPQNKPPKIKPLSVDLFEKGRLAKA